MIHIYKDHCEGQGHKVKVTCKGEQSSIRDGEMLARRLEMS